MKPIPKRSLVPLFTDLLEYRQAANDTIAYTRRMVERYGDVCECSFTGIKNYFIHDPEVIKEILTTQSAKMKRTHLFKAFRKFLGQGLFTADGEYHKKQRRLIKPVFYPQRVEGYADIMVQCAIDEMENWKDGETLDIQQAMTRITLNVITKTMFGKGMNKEEIAGVGDNLSIAFGLMNRILANPLWTFCLINDVKVPIVRDFYCIKSELDKVINAIIADYRKGADTDKSDLLTMLMDAKDEETGIGMTDEQIRDEVMTFFIAGHETTTLALTWTWYLLAKNPDWQTRFYAEVEANLENRLPQAANYPTLSNTKNIFRESLRLYPPAWTFARETTEDVSIQGYHFPKGSVLWTVTYLLHHNEKYFQDPEAFLPSRWEAEYIKTLPKYAYFPFGGGNRMCIGEGFAWMEGVLVLATIASKFRLTLPRDFSTEINPLFTLKAKHPILMNVQRLVG